MFPAAEQPRAPKPRIAPADLPRGTGVILVVDDDPMVRKVVSGSVGALGYTTIEAVSGSEAIEIYRTQHDQIRAVVLDMVMPGMPGKQTYLALRAIDSNVAVLLMSGHTMNEQVQEILDLGVRVFVSKPYSIGALATALAELTQ
jgi:CheY-like chemotaxis protein